MHGLRLALGFLTILPVPQPRVSSGDAGPSLGRAAVWFPVVGLALGAVLVAAHVGLGRLFSPLLAAAFAIGLWAALTGGLHLDGLADCCDGLLAAVPAERRLEIMRDPRLGAAGDTRHLSLEKARRVIDRTRALKPWAYVVHLDGREVRQAASPQALAHWQTQSVQALQLAADWAGGPEHLAVENLDGYPPDFVAPVIERVPVSRCVDVGHLWLDGHDPLPHLRAALPRTRVIHLHGVDGRDHQSVAHVPAEKLKAVLELLLHERYTGVLTLEVFGEEDFRTSLTALERGATGVRE